MAKLASAIDFTKCQNYNLCLLENTYLFSVSSQTEKTAVTGL